MLWSTRSRTNTNVNSRSAVPLSDVAVHVGIAARTFVVPVSWFLPQPLHPRTTCVGMQAFIMNPIGTKMLTVCSLCRCAHVQAKLNEPSWRRHRQESFSRLGFRKFAI
eukprot:m.1380286 g.1380286  ORF g.1380286 m.1380286 type:complete len:108 (+) comp24968_c0_seq58:1547-1870(+)